MNSHFENEPLNRYITRNNSKLEHGIWVYYYPMGEVWAKGNYHYGESSGIWEYYHKNGDIEEIEYYII